MVIFHLSDLHIGLKLMNRNLREDQEYILQQIVREAGRHQPDAVVIAGDLYDKPVPSAEAVEVFDRFLSGLARVLPSSEIMMISGNHDSSQRIDLYRDILGSRRIHMIGSPPRKKEDHIEKITLNDEYGIVHFYLLPFVKPSAVKNVIGVKEDGSSFSYNETLHRMIEREEIDSQARNVLVSHQFYLPAGKDPDDVERMDSEIRTVGNIDEVGADILERFDYAALGHIHKPMKVGSDVYRYCGTPLACSVSEAGQQKGVILVEMGAKGSVRTEVLPLEPLRQVCVIRGTLEEVLAQGCEDYARVVLTDPEDLNFFDMQDRIRGAFPNLLEIRRENLAGTDESIRYLSDDMLSPLELCESFLGNLEEEERIILRDVLNKVLEEQR